MNPMLIKWGIILLLVIAAGVAGWTQGYKQGSQRLVDYIGKQAVQTERVRSARERIVKEVQVVIKKEIEQVFIRGNTIVEEVPVYVTQADDDQCIIPVGFVRSFNSAVANAPASGSPSETDRTNSGVSLSTVAETQAFNQTICHAWKTRAKGWELFYNNLRKVTP